MLTTRRGFHVQGLGLEVDYLDLGGPIHQCSLGRALYFNVVWV